MTLTIIDPERNEALETVAEAVRSVRNSSDSMDYTWIDKSIASLDRALAKLDELSRQKVQGKEVQERLKQRLKERLGYRVPVSEEDKQNAIVESLLITIDCIKDGRYSVEDMMTHSPARVTGVTDSGCETCEPSGEVLIQLLLKATEQEAGVA